MLRLLEFNKLDWGQETPPGNRNGKRYSDTERKEGDFMQDILPDSSGYSPVFTSQWYLYISNTIIY